MSILDELPILLQPIITRLTALDDELDRLREAQHAAAPPAGWTPIPPIEPDSGARTVYVSSTYGQSTNTGLSPGDPVDTLARGISLHRDNAGDRLLLRAGDTFHESFGAWTKSGRSPEQPLVISTYGDGPRPRVVCAGSGFSVLTGEVHDVAIVGLHLAAAGRDPSLPDFNPTSPAGHGVRVIRPVANLLIEDCRIHFFTNNLTLTSGDAPGARLTNVRVRRCIVTDAWSTGGATSGQGLYASGCDGLLVEDCYFDHNGWNRNIPGATANIYRHNVYVSAANSDVTVRGNMIASAASHGLQLRCGGVVEDNVFTMNALHCLIAGATGRFRRNVVLGGRDIDDDNPRGFGLTLACADGRAERNLFAHKPATTGAALTVQRNEWTPAGPMRTAFVANIVYNWFGNGLEVTGDCDLLEFAGNDLQRCFAGRKLVNVRAKVGRYQLAANRYDTEEPARDRWFFKDGAFSPPGQWAADTGDTSSAQKVEYPDRWAHLPEGMPNELGARARSAWNKDETALAIAREIRQAFEA
jgi:hypothetical protein